MKNSFFTFLTFMVLCGVNVFATEVSIDSYSILADNAAANYGKLFNQYVKNELKIDTEFTLLSGSKLIDKKILVNPNGGKFDISTLTKDITHFKMLPDGGFSF